jgi:ABC-type cobalamin/Fe3+-siderophores transport system ATPase subunit
MHINKISISNILGITELEFSPEGFTQISGQNGSGKTSVLEAVKSVLQSGHDATLLRNGSDKGEVVLVLDDGMELSKTVTASASTTTVRRDGKKLTRPGEAIKALTDALSVNPVDFLLAPKKDRVKALLEAMPLEADTKHLAELAGFPVKAQPGLHALHVITLVHTQVYDERTGTNRAVKEKTATISQLEAAVPPAPVGVEGSEDDLQAQIDAAADNRDATMGKITAKLDGLNTDRVDSISKLRADAQARINEINALTQTAIDALNEGFAVQSEKAATARQNASAKFLDASQPLRQQLAIIRNDREASGRRQQTLDTIATMRTELETLTAQAAQQTQALDAIDNYKSELLNSLPIPGLEVRDGEIYRNDVPFDRLNTAQQVDVAVEIAKLRAADLGVICVDRIECLDSASLEAFKAAALESGLQLFITRVSDDEFSIETEN